MTELDADTICAPFLPMRAHYWYARCKLATDPLYRGVTAALDGTTAPLLDLGCGIGLLAHALRSSGFAPAYVGIDNDVAKIASSRTAADRGSLAAASFEVLDLSQQPFPAHHGSVALLDVMQFMPAAAALALLSNAAACIAPDGRLVIRTSIEGTGARMRFTRAVDRGSKRMGWMNAAPHWYPSRTQLEAALAAHGLRARFSPLTWLPFNNWLIVAERAQA